MWIPANPSADLWEATTNKHLKAISQWASLSRLGNTNSLFMFYLRRENTFFLVYEILLKRCRHLVEIKEPQLAAEMSGIMFDKESVFVDPQWRKALFIAERI